MSEMNQREREKDVCYSKLTWVSRDEAAAAAALAAWQHGATEAVPPRPYECRYCGKWHLARKYED